MTSVLQVESGDVIEARTGAALEVCSGAVIDVCGEAMPNQETDPEEPPTYLDPPVFGNIVVVPGRTSLTLTCDTDRAALVRFMAQLVIDGSTTGPLFYTGWEAVATTAGHTLSITGLTKNQTYRVSVEIDGSVDPDASWALFQDEVIGPDFATGGD